jgi:hypothetical protein
MESTGEKCLWNLIESWEVSTSESNIAIGVHLFFHGLIAAMSLVVQEFHAVLETNKRPVFICRFMEDISRNGDVIDVVKYGDGRVCFDRHFGRSF